MSAAEKLLPSKMPPLDGRFESYNIRRLDNRYRVHLHQPGWAAQGNHDYFYVSIEKLVIDHWEYVKATVKQCSTRCAADEHIIKLYETWETGK